VLARLDDPDPATTLLARAAALAPFRRAGHRPAAATWDPPPPCPPDPRPPVRAAAARRLEDLVAGRHRQLLPEWLDLLVAAGRRPPEEHAPALLDLATAQPTLRPTVATATGERGRWLAAFNPAWDWATGAGVPGGTAWATAPTAARLVTFAALRATDPDRARDLLASTWSSESGADRAAFVAALAQGLAAGDEPFLEAALDDRRREVRAAAADLLARLPASRLARRMADRLAALRRPDGTIGLPDHPGPDLLRDGVDPKPPRGVGERSWWLAQVVAAAPLDTGTWGPAPPPLPPTGEHGDLLVQAWARAAVRQRNAPWARALLDRTGDPALLAALPPGEAQAVVIAAVQARGLTDTGPTPGPLALLAALPGPWGPTLSHAVVAAVGGAMAEPGPAGPLSRVAQALGDLALRLDPAVALDLARCSPPPGSWWWNPHRQALDVLTVRHQMRRELLR
jgi:hypothetical protein